MPGDPQFDSTLAVNLPFGWRNNANQNHGEIAFVADSSTGLLRPVNNAQLEDYLYGGEYDERMGEIE